MKDSKVYSTNVHAMLSTPEGVASIRKDPIAPQQAQLAILPANTLKINDIKHKVCSITWGHLPRHNHSRHSATAQQKAISITSSYKVSKILIGL
jgi:hypothetical protein